MREIRFKNSQDASMYNKGYEQGRADAIEECRKILLNDCDCKKDRAVEDETDCVNCMAKRMEKLKEKNNGIL